MKAIFNKDQVVNWLLSKQSMTPKKLQKMLYYEYSLFLVLLNNNENYINKTLFNDTFQAWVHGPVDYDVYEHFKKYGYRPIPKINYKLRTNKKIVLQNMNFIFNIYKNYNGDELERLTHKEEPWQEARQDVGPLNRSQNPLNNKTIYNYYSKAAGLNS